MATFFVWFQFVLENDVLYCATAVYTWDCTRLFLTLQGTIVITSTKCKVQRVFKSVMVFEPPIVNRYTIAANYRWNIQCLYVFLCHLH